MDKVWPFLVVLGSFAVVLGALARLAVHVRHRGSAGAGISAALASYDEAFRATAHDSHYEIQAQSQRKAPLPSPDDGPGRSPSSVRPGYEPRQPSRQRPRTGPRGLHALRRLTRRRRDR
ncbi:hypothetical protein [Streptomyces physcomitrii]|uniref:Secreted protein n=1 Tax=Streptomyces physcomitrii TaxID=2724184 RepID=A0ABX1GVG8_9ACTN|nr:hypothetical protein [Streptomyces physcomitrii]NKI40052.1 hypothetical protein [Streptomyces physcomitrii]